MSRRTRFQRLCATPGLFVRPRRACACERAQAAEKQAIRGKQRSSSSVGNAQFMYSHPTTHGQDSPAQQRLIPRLPVHLPLSKVRLPPVCARRLLLGLGQAVGLAVSGTSARAMRSLPLCQTESLPSQDLRGFHRQRPWFRCSSRRERVCGSCLAVCNARSSSLAVLAANHRQLCAHVCEEYA
jgi:hypothetical protein